MSVAVDKASFLRAIESMMDTKFRHQGRVPGVGVDCVGVVVCALKDAGGLVNDKVGYSRIPSNGLLMRSIREHCEQINQSEVSLGDIMLFDFGHEPQHVAVVTGVDPLTLTHAYSSVGKVVKNGFDDTWKRRLVACFRIKDMK